MKKTYIIPEWSISNEVVQNNLLLSGSPIDIKIDDAPVSADDAAVRQENNWDLDLTSSDWD